MANLQDDPRAAFAAGFAQINSLTAPDGWMRPGQADLEYRQEKRIQLLGDWVGYLLARLENIEHNVPTIDEDLEPGFYDPETGAYNPNDD